MSYEEADAALTLLRADLMRNVPQPRGGDTFAAYGRLPQAQAPNAERLVAAAWAAVTTL